ncbi:PIN domain-like protein [Mycena galericulata]|nr:PIN domain-like protein [Mycena galericulata]
MYVASALDNLMKSQQKWGSVMEGVIRDWHILESMSNTSRTQISADYLSGKIQERWQHTCSIWLSECPDNSGTLGNGPALEKLFDQLCALLRLAVTAVFVFPRADSSEFKSINKAKISHPLKNQFQALVKVFGFHCHNAPGEADAELAYLNRLELIDIIFTVNEEVFVFGTNQKYLLSALLMCHNPSEDDYQEAYFYTTAEIHRKLCLSHGGLLLMAILIGGDYVQRGLVGCSEHVAYTLARRGLGDPLLLAAQTLGSTELHAFLHVWRCALRQELTRAPLVIFLLVQRYRTRFQILRFWSYTSDPSLLGLSVIRLQHTVKLRTDISPKPYNELKLLQDHVLRDQVDETVSTLSPFIDIRTFSGGFYHVKFSTHSITSTIISSLRGSRPNRPDPAELTKTMIYLRIPPPILLHGLPGMVKRYERCKSVSRMKREHTPV